MFCADVLPKASESGPSQFLLISWNQPPQACAEVLGLEKPTEASEGGKFH